jgi:hypothetical protein
MSMRSPALMVMMRGLRRYLLRAFDPLALQRPEVHDVSAGAVNRPAQPVLVTRKSVSPQELVPDLPGGRPPSRNLHTWGRSSGHEYGARSMHREWRAIQILSIARPT